MNPSGRADEPVLVANGLWAALIVAVCFPAVLLADQEQARCKDCHAAQAGQLAESVHRALNCRECHQGQESYSVADEELGRLVQRATGSGAAFDHGESFAGAPARGATPMLCGNCHADVERMNPYGLRTDQLSRYWTSGHGKALKERGDERVAVCVDCHGWHDILPGHEPGSKTHPLNVPGTCARCHSDANLMGAYDLPVEVVTEYRASVHGHLLLEQKDTGAPTCATCHGNHSAMPPGFATVGAVCGQCHQHAAQQFATSVHAEAEGHKGCVQCHGGGEGSHYHMIERITQPAGVLIQRYAHLLSTEPSPTPEQVTEAIHPDPKRIMTQALPTCTECHDDPAEDENLPRLFALLDEIADAERHYVQTAARLDEVGQGVLLVENQRFKFEDAKTHLIELSPVQHSLDNDLVAEKVAALNQVCEEVNAELDELQAGLRLRNLALIPIWAFAVVFSVLLYVKYKMLKRAYVKPLD
ncbi:MAG TPA: hypothetical protein VM243_18675 [Phycisphaerae bacterium]|nr:hypothetical protein [Phycisphaerae bacterium]